MKSVLRVNQLQLQVHLGVGDQERSRPQEVRLNISIEFQSPPLACQTDEVSDTVDYFIVCERLKSELTANSFKTIEHMAHRAFLIAQESIGPKYAGELILELHKVSPPVADLLGGTQFVIRGNL